MIIKLTTLLNLPKLMIPLLVMLVSYSGFSAGNSAALEAATTLEVDAKITGTVISGEDALPLIGVTVLVKGTSRGSATDVEGNFSIEAEEGEILVFSYTGFKDQEVVVGSTKSYNIILKSDTELIDEVVVVGYGTQKKSHLTGSVSKVTNKKLDQIAVARVDDALVGQVSGVNIQNTTSEAGAAPTITIRGFGSVTADSGPAVVVDGIVVDPDFLGNLDMNDIESFEILKDAASAAIYGSEGSNGVILITTKSGKSGKTKFSYETYFGRKEAFGSEIYKKSVADWAAKELAENGSLSNPTQYMQQLVSVTGIDRDWQDVFFDGGNISSHSFSARGGSDNTKFSVSLRTVGDEGVVLTDDYRLYSGKLKVSTEVSDDLKFGISITPSYSRRRALPTSSVHNPLRQSPWLPIYHTEATLDYVDRAEYPDVAAGDYFLEDHLKRIDIDTTDELTSTTSPRITGDTNPYAQFIEREHYEFNTKLLSSTYLQYKIAKGLTAKTSLGVTIENRKRTRYDGVLHHGDGASRSQYQLQNRLRTRLISDNTLAYNRNFNKHELGTLLGLTVQKRISEDSQITGRGFSNDLLKNLEGATVVDLPLELNSERNKIGYFARINYAFDNKYLINASYRRDGSSVFGSETKWGDFPAVSVGWNAHREPFLANLNDVVSRLKFRVSYGLTGNENFNLGTDVENAYAYLSLLEPVNAVIDGNIRQGIIASIIANSALQWESSREFNPGIDFGFAGNRITGSIDYYVRTSDNLLLNNPVSYGTGFASGIVNLGEVENSGWEFELRTKNLAVNKFSWATTFIASTNKNELINFGENNGALTEDANGRNSQWINLVGNPISSYYGYVLDQELPTEFYSSPYLPINGKSGDVIVKDLNGDGIITDEDKTILGDPYANIIWSVTNEFYFGNLDFSFMLQGSLGGQIRNLGDEYFFALFNGLTNSPKEVVDAGIIADESFLRPRVQTNDIIQNAGYFTLRNVNIGYNFKDKLSRFGLTDLRIYASAQNLFYKTADDYTGFNPEYDNSQGPQSYGYQRGGKPNFRTVTAGLNIKF